VTESLIAPSGLVRDSVYGRIRADVLTCVLRPGTQIQERELADQYGVSKSPVRDALLRLQEQNLIEVLPRKGYRVKPISITEVSEMYEMRLILERACVLRLVEQGSADTLERLDEYRRLSGDTTLEMWIAYNRNFHLALADSGNRRLTQAARDIIEQFDRLTFMNMSNVQRELGNLQHFVDEHAQIVDAIQRRDKRGAAALIKEHVEHSRAMFFDQIGSLSVVP